MSGYLDVIGLPGLVGTHAFSAIPFVGETDVYYLPERNPLYIDPLANNVIVDPQSNPVRYLATRNPLYFDPLSNPVFYDPDDNA
jgi:hypothetical protein